MCVHQEKTEMWAAFVFIQQIEYYSDAMLRKKFDPV